VTSIRPDSAEDIYQQGFDLLAAGSPAEAARAFRSAIHADRTHMDAYHGLVRALRDSGRLEQAIGAALALTALTPNDPLAHTVLAVSLRQAGHLPEAEAAAARARIEEWKMELRFSRGEDTLP
jgi:Flp pilus assembly protein TadD